MGISVDKNGENITLEAQDDFTAVGSDGEEEAASHRPQIGWQEKCSMAALTKNWKLCS